MEEVRGELGGVEITKEEGAEKESFREKIRSLVESKDRGFLVDFVAGSALDLTNDIAKSIELRGKSGDELFSAWSQNMDVANDLLTKMEETEDPEEKKRLKQLADAIFDDVTKNAQEVEGSFSKSVGQHPLLRGLFAGTEIAGVAEIPSLIKGGVKLLTGGLFRKEATEEALKFAGKEGGEEAVEFAGKQAPKGRGLLGTTQRFIESVKGKMPAAQLAKRQAEEAAKAITKVNIGDELLKSAKKVADIDPDVEKQLIKEAGKLKNVKDIPTLLDRMSVWGRNAYKRGGDIKSTAKATLYSDFYKSGLEILKTEAPEVYKYRRLLGYTHQFPIGAARFLWRAALAKATLFGL